MRHIERLSSVMFDLTNAMINDANNSGDLNARGHDTSELQQRPLSMWDIEIQNYRENKDRCSCSLNHGCKGRYDGILEQEY